MPDNKSQLPSVYYMESPAWCDSSDCLGSVSPQWQLHQSLHLLEPKCPDQTNREDTTDVFGARVMWPYFFKLHWWYQIAQANIIQTQPSWSDLVNVLVQNSGSLRQRWTGGKSRQYYHSRVAISCDINLSIAQSMTDCIHMKDCK